MLEPVLLTDGAYLDHAHGAKKRLAFLALFPVVPVLVDGGVALRTIFVPDHPWMIHDIRSSVGANHGVRHATVALKRVFPISGAFFPLFLSAPEVFRFFSVNRPRKDPRERAFPRDQAVFLSRVRDLGCSSSW